MKKSFATHALVAAVAAIALGGCTTEPRVTVNTSPAVVAPAPAYAVVTPAPATVVMGAGTFTAVDRDFAFTAALANMTEIGASQMAGKHTSSGDVLDLAGMINQHHTMAMNDLIVIMRARGMSIPGDISPSQRHLMDKLGTDYGYEYDRDFVRLVGVRAHQQDIAYFQNQMGRLGDPDLRNWAARNLPLMQQHLNMALDISGRIAG